MAIEARRGIALPRAIATGSHELSNTGAGNWTEVQGAARPLNHSAISPAL